MNDYPPSSDGADSTHRSHGDDAGIRRTLARIALEVLVGFVGVYAAFALTAYHEKRELIDRRHQIKRALIAEIRPLTELSRHNTAGYRSQLAAFDAAVKQGSRPVPRPYVEAVGLNTHVWDATKQAGGLELIDVPTFVQLANFYNDISEMLAFYSQLRELSVNVILPNLDRPDAFYDARTGALRPELRSLYYTDVQALGNLSEQATKNGDALIRRLAADTI